MFVEIINVARRQVLPTPFHPIWRGGQHERHVGVFVSDEAYQRTQVNSRAFVVA